MALYFLSCDICDARNYELLYDELKNFNATKVLDSTWSIEHTNTDVQNLMDHFRNFIDPNDSLKVTEALELA